MNIPYTDIRAALARLPIKQGEPLLVHSSLKSAGYIEGGADTVITALLDAVGAAGTLVMPTLSQKDFPHAYRDWHIDRPSDVGYITEVFRLRPDAHRSDQATHSVAAVGQDAVFITADHGTGKERIGTFGSTPFAHVSPWQKMYDRNAAVLLFGVDLTKNTFTHLWEYILVEKALEKAQSQGRYEEALRKVLTFSYRGIPATGRLWPYLSTTETERVGEASGLFTRTTLGNATLTVFFARDLGETVLRDVARNPHPWIYPEMVNWITDIYGGTIPLDAFL